MAVEQKLPLTWSLDLGRKYPDKRIVVGIIAIVAATIGYFVVGGPVGILLGGGVVIASLAELFFPLKYQLDETGASVRCGLNTTAIRWENVKRLITMPDGVRLSPLEKSTPLDAFRGVYVRFSSNESEVLATIAELAEQYGCHLDGRTEPSGGGALDRDSDL